MSAAPQPDGGTWWYDALSLDDAHQQATGEGVTIALVDTMVDPTVADLQGADVVPVAGYCDIEYDGLDSPPVVTADPGAAAVAGPAADHATSMTALMVGTGRGTGPGGAGVRGVAPDATVRVYATADDADGAYECQGDGRAGAAAVSGAIADAVADDVDIINISLDATGDADAMQQAVRDAVDAGIVVVGAAGNDGTDQGSEVGPGAVSVVGVGRDGGLTESSSYGIDTVVAAPGAGIAAGRWLDSGWDSTVVSDGTSGASAIVTASLALVMSRYPGATGNQVVQHLIRNTTSDTLEWNEQLGFGIIALNTMLASDPTMWQDVNPILHVDGLVELIPTDYPDDAALASAAAPTAADSPADDPASEPAAPPADNDGSGGPAPLLLVGLALLVVAGAAVLWARRRRTPTPPEGPTRRPATRDPAVPGGHQGG